MRSIPGMAAFAALVLSIVAGCITVNTQAASTPPDWTIAHCGATHLPAYTRTDMCIAADGTVTSLPLTAHTVPLSSK